MSDTTMDQDTTESPPVEESQSDQASENLGTRHIEDTPELPETEVAQELATRHISGAPPTPDSTKTSEPASIPEGSLKEGTLLQDRYRVIGVIGAGGMSTVYNAQDLRFPQVMRVCAIKEMINTATNPEIRASMVRNFEREANILATLSHPCIPQVFDYFSESSRSYLVMELIEGKDLEAVLNETDGFLSEAQVVEWALQICEVLGYLHYRKPSPVVFRDMKPSNVMIDQSNRVRLVDFGIAKVFQSGEKGTMIGTEGYSPPEQYRGLAEPRGDLYSLGATMHHLLSKQDPRLEPPFSFHDRPIVESNPLVSPELEEIIVRALEYDINRRFGSAEEMHMALANLHSARRPAMPGGTGDFHRGEGPEAIWQFACEDEIRSNPTVADGVLYVSAYDHNLYALEADTGKFVWKYATDGGIGSSPNVTGNRVFVGSNDGVVYSINTETGRIQWTCPTKAPVYSSPRCKFGHVFFGSDDGNLYAVAETSGRIVWNFAAEGAVRSSPAVGEETILFGDEAGTLYAVGVNGQVKWRFRSKKGIMSSPLLHKEMMYVGSKDRHIYALDANTGWAVWRYRTGGAVISSPVIGEGTVFVGSADCEVYALDATSGNVLWKFQTGGQVSSDPAFFEGAVYVGSSDGCVYCLDARNGRLRWRFQTGGPVISAPCVTGGILYFGSCDHYVYALPI
jgi:outer membrane protein assembly factor BamB/tRNA A-37 threonylcarbamoyl transferase component Bud32